MNKLKARSGNYLFSIFLLLCISPLINFAETDEKLRGDGSKENLKKVTDQLSELTIKTRAGMTCLIWYTNNDREDGIFMIERAVDGEPFVPIGTKDRIPARHNNIRLRYSYVDEEVCSMHLQYRVTQFNMDGTIKDSETATLTYSVRVPY